VHALVIRHLGLVAGLDQGLEALHDELGGAAAEHRLLAEQIGFGFLAERGFNELRARAADAGRVGQHALPRVAAGVLLHREQARHAGAVLEFAAHQRAGAFRRDQDHVDIGARLDHAVVHVEPVREQQRTVAAQMWGDGLAVQLRLHHVRGEHGDQITAADYLGRRGDRKAIGARLRRGGAAGAQADAHIEPGIAQIERVRAALTAVAEHADALASGRRCWLPGWDSWCVSPLESGAEKDGLKTIR